jgi:hypothetical protein
MADLDYNLNINADTANKTLASIENKLKFKASIDTKFIEKQIAGFSNTSAVIRLKVPDSDVTRISTIISSFDEKQIKLKTAFDTAQISKELQAFNNNTNLIRFKVPDEDITRIKAVFTSLDEKQLKIRLALDKAQIQADLLKFNNNTNLVRLKIPDTDITRIKTVLSSFDEKQIKLKAVLDSKQLSIDLAKFNNNTNLIRLKIPDSDITRLKSVQDLIKKEQVIEVKVSGLDRLKSSIGSAFSSSLSGLGALDVSKFANLSNAGKTAGSSFVSGFSSIFTVAIGNVIGNGISSGISGIKESTKGFANNAISIENANVQLVTYNKRTLNAVEAQKQATKTIAELTAYAAATPYEFPELIDTVTRLRQFGFGNEEAIATTKRLADVAGGSADKLSRLTTVFGTIKSQEFVTAGQVNQLTKLNFTLADLAEATGLTTKQFAKLKSTSKLTKEQTLSYDELKGVLDELTSTGGLFFNNSIRQSQTLGGLLSNLPDFFGQAFNKLVGVQDGAVNGLEIAIEKVGGIDTGKLVRVKDALGNLVPIGAFGVAKLAISDLSDQIRRFDGGQIGAKLGKGVEDGYVKVKEVLPKIGDFIKNTFSAINFDGLFAGVSNAIGKIDFIKVGNGVTSFTKGLSDLFTKISETPTFKFIEQVTIDTINTGAKVLNDLGKALSGLNKDQVQLVLDIVGAIASAVVAVDLLVKGLLIYNGILAITAVLQGVALAPILLLVAGFALLGVGIFLIVRNFDTLKKSAINVKNTVTEFYRSLENTQVGGALLKLNEIVKNVVLFNLKLLLAVVVGIAGAILAIPIAIIGVITVVTGLINKFVQTPFFAGVVNGFISGFLLIFNIFKTIVIAIEIAIGAIVIAVVGTIAIIVGLVAGFFIGIGYLIGLFILNFSSIWESVRTTAINVFANITTSILTWYNSAINNVQGFYNFVVSVFNGVLQAGKDIWNNIVTAIIGFKDQAVATFESFKTSAVEKFNDLKKQASDKLDELVTSAKNTANNILAPFKNIANDIGAFFKNIVIAPIKVGWEWLGGSPSAPQNYSGNRNFQGGITEIAERGRELVKLPNGLLSMFNDRQMTVLPKGSRIYNNSETERILDGGISNQIMNSNNVPNQNTDNRNYTKVTNNYSSNYNQFNISGYLTGLNS